MTDELKNLRSIPFLGTTDEWMDSAIRWGVAEIERLRAEREQLRAELADTRKQLCAALHAGRGECPGTSCPLCSPQESPDV